MLRIRFARTGKKKNANYRIVVAEKSRAVTAKFVEILGWYNPHSKESNINKEKIESWLGKGASPSNSMAIFLEKEGIKLPDWVIINKKVSKPKSEKKEEKTKETKADETVEGSEEVSPEEVKQEKTEQTGEETKETEETQEKSSEDQEMAEKEKEE